MISIFFVIGLSISVGVWVLLLQARAKARDVLLEHLGEVVVIFSGKNKSIWMNRSARDLLGDNIDLRHPLWQKIQEKLQEVRKESIETVCWGKRCFQMRFIPHKKKVFLLIQDRSSQQKILEMGKDFIANASHELKTPTMIIRGFAEMLQDMKDMPKEMLDGILEKIIRNCKRMDALVRSLLTLSDVESIDLTQTRMCDIADVVEESKRSVLSIYPYAKLSVESLSEVVAEVDPNTLELAITNVLENAVKYSAEEADIKVSIREESDRAIVSVHDRGIGISEEDLDHIFDRFYTVNKAHSRKLGGAGLGLSIVKTIIDKHQGKMHVSSTLGQGSTFTLSLPTVRSRDKVL